MPSTLFTQYQIRAQPPEINQPGPGYESQWHRPLTEPVRLKINPILAVALTASGLFAPTAFPGIIPGPSYESTFHHAWSEPVKQKIDPRLSIALAASGVFSPTFDNTTVLARVMSWYASLATPVRQPIGLKAYLQLFTFIDAHIIPRPNTLMSWWAHFRDPVRLKPGLGVGLQQTFTYPPRLLPPVDVILTMTATETNADVPEMAINVYDPDDRPANSTGAKVSVVEITQDGDPVSVSEN